MDLKQKAKAELESRVQKIENFIAERGIGSTYLDKAKRTQRNVNLAIALGGLIAIVGLTAWALSGNSSEEEA